VQYRVPWVSGRGGGNSFAAGTGVVTGVDENGNPITTNIEDLQIGDVVLSGNELDPSDPTRYTLVTDVSSRTVYEQTVVTYVDDAGNIEVLKTTEDHSFYVEGSGWTTAANLQQGDLLTLSDGQTATVTNTATLEVPEGLTVYNLTVSNGSTYFVDDGQGNVSAVWVHNRNSVIQKAFRKALGLVKGDGKFAAHIVPLKTFKRLAPSIQGSIRLAQRVLKRSGVDLNTKINGFVAKTGSHSGTHRKTFLGVIGPRLKAAEQKAIQRLRGTGATKEQIKKAVRFEVIKELRRLKKQALQGKF
jgi:filamentous hemagglutinin